MASANAELAILNQRYREQNPTAPDADPAVVMSAGSLRDLVVGDLRSKVLVLSAAVGVVGLAATYAAVKAGKQVALSNKEVLVVAGEIFMAGDRDQFVRTVFERRQIMRHVLDEARLATSGRSLEQHRQSRSVSGREDFHFVVDRQVKRCGRGVEMADFGPLVTALHPRVEFFQFNRHRSPIAP